jgi:septal ring-binding cell division protein DamX
MSAASEHDLNQDEPDVASDAMKDQLRKDVASWREGRADGSSRQATELSVAVARATVPPTTAKMKRAKPAPAEATQAASGKKPFGMSYDGTSRAEYIKLMIARGAR